MRITNSMTTARYIRQLSNLETSVGDSSTKVSSGDALTRFSDDTTASVKSYKIRRTLNKVESYQANINHADTYLTDSEAALNNMEDIYQYAMEKTVQGQNATESAEERKTIATELHSLQKELLSTLNTNVSGTYLFGGTNVESEPFTVDVNGSLIYNGSTLNSLDSTDTVDAKTIQDLSADSRYVNIGLNLQFNASGLVESSVFGYSIQGINITGYGNTGTTVPIDGAPVTVSKNMYDLLGQIADAFEASDYTYETTDTLYKQFQASSSGISQGLTTVGAKQNYLDFMKDRYSTQTLNLEDKQSEIEDVDLPSAIIKYKTDEVALNAALQMSSSVLQKSIFDYMS